MDPIWLDSYPPGVPSEIDPDKYRSIGEMFSESAARYADYPAFTCMGKTYSYGELDRLSRAFAAYLQGELCLERGARVAIMMPNVLQYPIAMLGVLRAGYTVVNCNPLYTPRELGGQLADSGAKAIVIVENFAHTLEQVLDQTDVEHVIVTRLGDMLDFPKASIVNLVVKRVKKMVPQWHIPGALWFKETLSAGAKRAYQPVDVGPDELAFLQYTGGTTGIPKGAMLSHRNMIANLEQAHAWIKPHVREGQEVIVTALPLYHIFALLANCLTFMKIGAKNVLITNPRDIPAFVKELSTEPFTALTGVNTLFNALLHNEDFRKLDFSALRLTLGGGMAVQKSVAHEWKEVTGTPLVEAYGLTETSPAATINPLEIEEYTGSIGLPISSTEVSIRTPEGEEVRVGEPGELCIRGPQVMKGYWQKPDETALVFTEDGFLRTGDMARIDDDGFIYIIDRTKDMINVSGFNVYPNEIESVIASHPGIVEAGVVGIPDEQSGETVKAVVVKKDPDLTEDDIIAFCREQMTPYKVPRQIEFRDELPKSVVGKILRRELRDNA
ncbi:long-chain-fatty-acid--CoA ligase [Dichotomicrobium thermohalophilum]|uniref:Long-chain-fatty-acid--CoA ligase n=1 Tax=Dichotomicrobium thermohalophilum TaxID=933063 RepID=A0A397Q403_9HYPH|nr:long-chain-fatty-acid--CoA ligase [Dichotomicrobium thermohalophilum]RIA56250.1 long-chain acyl-CoA synthetase [Dichotomicrobium thermohalophilum]